MNERSMNFEAYLEKFGTLAYTGTGVSMRPLIRRGRDVIIIKRKGQARCRKFDTVLFKRSNGEYVLHRVLQVRADDYYIIGDSCFTGEYVKDDQILGVMTELKRDNRRISVTDRGYRRYVRLWWKLFRLRRGMMFMRTRLHSMGKKVLGILWIGKTGKQ